MKPISEIVKNKPAIGWIIFIGTALIVFILGLIASSIIQRRTEAQFAYTPQIDLKENDPRNNEWGKYFPREYQSYIKTADTTFKSKYYGAAMIDMLEQYPELVVLWAGYSFSKDYNQGRGHAYSVEDIRNTLRTGAPFDEKPSPQPNTCWTCKSPDVPRLMQEMGIADFYKGSWDALGGEVYNYIGCADCHDVKTMNLRISRPHLVEAFQNRGLDISNSSHQEMRSLVCAQCHVEYYFNTYKAEGVSYLTLPWDKGLTVENIQEYYDNLNFKDWTHQLSKAPMLKAQHPDYELYTLGTHASRGVSCADCHMPYKSEGGQKFTDHHIQSPLNNVANSCQVCHREETAQLIKDVYDRQDKVAEIRTKLEKLLVKAHIEAKLAWDQGAEEYQMINILKLIRNAQWRWDYTAASHGASFHAPLETTRILANGIDKAQEARIELSRLFAQLGHSGEVQYPDISTKQKAQDYIGLPMKELKVDKERFKKEVLPKWNEAAKQRENQWK